MKIKKAFIGFMSLSLILINLNLGVTTFGGTPDPVMPTSTFCSILKK